MKTNILRMKKFGQHINSNLILGLISILFIFSTCDHSPKDLKSALEKIPGVTVNVMESDSMYSESYELWFTQPVDHNNPKSETFQQRVLLSHVGYDRPTVLILEGYSIFTDKPGELSKLFNANQITIEHRFFANSRPDSIPWSYLTIKQAADDQHEVIQTLKKIYKQKWISTGISKGGQTTIYHRRFYPDDVDVSVPYVAPLNFSEEDSRIYTFLNNVGTKECREKIYNYQISLFENKEKLMPMVEQVVQQKNYTFTMGLDRAYDLSVLEFPFAFWQWCGNCNDIPDKNSSIDELLKEYWTVNPLSFFDEKETNNTLPFFYQALTEIGMYGYEVDPFKNYLKDTANITFEFTMPYGVNTTFNPESMRDINNWVQNDGNYMLYIYGENDAWSSTAVEPSGKTIAVKMVNPGGCHETRISSFPDDMQESIYKLLESWLDVQIKREPRSGGQADIMFEVL